MDGLGSASPPVAPTATTGEGRHPCTWPRTFWFKPLSAFGLLDLTTFISSSPELAMPSTLAPNRLSASSRRALSREARPPWVGEVTLSQELRTARLPRPHVLVGYQWSHTGLRPGRKTSHNRYIRSFVSHPPQIRACTSRAPGSSSHEFATRAIRCRYVDMVQVTMYLPGFSSTAHETASPSLDGVPRVGSPPSTVLCGAATPCRPFRRASFPSLGDTIVASVVRPPRTRSRGSIWSWWAVSSVALLDGNDRVSQAPGGTLVIIRHTPPTPV